LYILSYILIYIVAGGSFWPRLFLLCARAMRGYAHKQNPSYKGYARLCAQLCFLFIEELQ